MSGYIKYFENGGKNMFFIIEDDSVLVKYNQIWNNVKKTLNIKFYSMPIYDKKYVKAKLKEFNGVVNKKFWGHKITKEGVHYTCITLKKKLYGPVLWMGFNCFKARATSRRQFIFYH